MLNFQILDSLRLAADSKKYYKIHEEFGMQFSSTSLAAIYSGNNTRDGKLDW